MGETTIIIDHTGVLDALRGRGVGEALVRRGVEDARAERSPTSGQTAIAVLLFENLAIVPFLLLVTLLAPSG
ncbi:GNAT family N-acetyltransferase [Sulfitobacter sp.]|uniref:GNAT family N-acetyltransferase n=1 Tax=Sulfitobacter sp. TaxID=1903071 RepID=UPI0030033324